MNPFQFIKGAKFFPKYAPTVTNWKHKMRGKDGHNHPISFTEADKSTIATGLKQLAADLVKAAL